MEGKTRRIAQRKVEMERLVGINGRGARMEKKTGEGSMKWAVQKMTCSNDSRTFWEEEC